MFGSSWANPQQNQQNQQGQQQPSAFGQPSGFGGTGAFGSGGAFGQPQPPQQQQPQANPMFGNLGGGTNTGSTGTGFGAFGSTNTSNAGGGLFGQPKPTTGFGAFGGGGTTAFGSTTATPTPAFGGGGAFGSSTPATGSSTGTNLFGSQPSTSTSAFGGGGGLFGANKPATGFGTTQTSTDGGAPVTTGTANPPFSPYTEKDNINPSITLQYQSITAMPQYRSSTFEELRLQDYQQGRKTAGAFGQTTFGAPAQPAQPTGGLFGQPAAPAATGTTFGGFGNTSTTAQPATTGFGAFGQPANTTNTTGGSLFGGGGAFGQPSQPQQPQQQQPQQPAGFGAFGQPQNQQNNTGGGLFGGGGAFGANNQAKPAFGASTTGFGGGGAFGQPQTNPQQPAAGGLFGQPQQNTATTGFGNFGTANSNAQKPSLFGATNTTQPATTGFGGFGTQNQAQPQQGSQPAGGLFGGGGGLFGQPQQQNQQQPAAGGLFGTTQPAQQQQQQPGGGLFGGGGGLFGTQQQPAQQGAQAQPQQNSFGGLFGAPKPTINTTQPTGGLFGGGFGSTLGQQPQNQQPATGLFGSTLGQQPQNQQNTNSFGSGGLFGKPAAPNLGASMSTGQQQGGLGTSLFGNSTLGGSTATMGASTLGQSQAPLMASIAQPIAAPLPIFSMLPPGPRAVTLDQQPKKKPGYFVDVPTRSPVPQLQLRYAPAGTKLRGFGSTSTPPGASSSTLGGSLLYSSGKPNALSLSKASTTKSLLGPDAFLTNGAPSPTLGSGGRQSVKKLTLDKKVEAADLFSKSNNGPSFSPALGLAAREKEAAAANGSYFRQESPSPAARKESPKKSNRIVAQSTSEILGQPSRPGGPGTAPAKGPQDPEELQEGDYWVKPDLETLKKMGHDELMSFSGLTVGRVGYGQITFLEPVDLTGLPRLSSLLGEVIRFDDKECSVYPEADDAEKPPPGSGLNVKARLDLVRCWALDKASREPIKDPEHPAAQRHLKRLKTMKETQFEGFDLEEGRWTFTVDHF
ncbi:hypothetical protein VTO73DRAFT_3287 [Trametes versicolor]